MRRKQIIFIFVLFVFLAAFVCLLARHRALPKSPPNVVTNTDPQGPQPFARSASTNRLIRPADIDDRVWSAIKEHHQRLVADNGPISFYAQVFDQDAKAVEGAELRVLVEAYPEIIDTNRDRKGNRQKENLLLTSDQSGRIAVTGKHGCVLRIESLVRNGYLWKAEKFISFDYAPTHFSQLPDYADPARGAVFKMWRKGAAAPLIPVKLNVWLGDGVTNAYVNLFTGVTANPEEADLVFKETMLAPDDPQRPYDRRIEIRGLGATKLLYTNVAYAYSAPEAGYHSDFAEERLVSNISSPPQPEWTRVFFVRARNGKVFAGLKVHFVGNQLRFDVEGYINPASSRNLEPDLAKLIEDPNTIRSLDLQTRSRSPN